MVFDIRDGNMEVSCTLILAMEKVENTSYCFYFVLLGGYLMGGKVIHIKIA
jgi:hypothetical protein